MSKRAPKPKGKTQKKRRPINKWRFRPLASLLTASTILGGAVALLAFLPRPLVTLSDPVIPGDPWSANVVVSNNNFIPLTDSTLEFGMGQITTVGRTPSPSFIPSFKSRILIGSWQHHTIEMDERYSVPLADSPFRFTYPTNFADIALIVSYRPWILPFRREKVFRFVTHKAENGNLYWYSLPLHEVPPPNSIPN